MKNQKSIFVIGPTASGKSDLAIELAKKYNGEVISCDSRQIYRGMDIGSGKEPGRMSHSTKRGPYTQDAYMIDGVPHYMIDTHHPRTIYSADKFVRKAQKIRDDIIARGKLPIIAGGTLFWAQGLVEGSVGASVPPNAALRRKYTSYTPERLMRLLHKKDPARAEVLTKNNEINNKIRIIRSLEIVESLGSVPPTPQIDYKKISEHTLIIAITPDQETLYQRIEKRLKRRIDEGMLEEVWSLHHDHGVPWTRLEDFGLEYRWCMRYLRGQISLEEMDERLEFDIKHYAKRQLTWICRWEKHGANIHRITKPRIPQRIVSQFLKRG